MIKRILAVLASVSLFGLVVSAPAQADYPPADNSVTVSSQNVGPGEAVTIAFAAGSFGEGESVALSADGTSEINVTLSSTVAQKSAVSFDYSKSLGNRTAGSDGSLSVNVAFQNAGKYTVTGTGSDSSYTSPVITVSGGGSSPVGPNGPTHPQTGGISAVPLVAGIALLALGGLAILVSRRRNTN